MLENVRSFVGPHEGREFDLMLAAQKPLSMFVIGHDEEFSNYPDPRFEAVVSNGRFVKTERIERHLLPNGEVLALRRILYARAEEAWRIPAMLMVEDLYQSLLPGRRADLERVIGALLGYDRADIEAFAAQFVER
jgi:hypothetical protein